MLRSLLRGSLLVALLAGVALLPGSEGWSGVVAEGDRLASEHRLLSALDHYTLAAPFPEAFPTLQLRLGRIYLRRGQPREAAKAFRSAVAAGAGGREALLGLAEASGQVGDGQTSLGALRRALELRPSDAEAWNRLVEWAAREGRSPAEIRDLLKGLPFPGGGGALGQRADYLLAACWLEPGDEEASSALSEAAAGPNPTIKGMALELLEAGDEVGDAARATGEARALLAQGLAGPALVRLEGLLTTDPPLEAEAWALRGYALKLVGRTGQAEEAARRSLEIEPDHPLGGFVLGTLLVARGDAEGAVALLRRVVDREPDNPALYLELAGALIDLGDYGDAQKALDLAVQAAPESPELRLAVARFYVDRQYRFETGLAEAREAVRLTGGSAEARGTLAWALHLLGRSDEALVPAREAVAVGPESPLWRYRLGSIYEALGQRDRAREQYQMVEELDGAGDLRQRAQAALADLGL